MRRTALLLSLSLLLVACGGTKTTETTPAPASETTAAPETTTMAETTTVAATTEAETTTEAVVEETTPELDPEREKLIKVFSIIIFDDYWDYIRHGDEIYTAVNWERILADYDNDENRAIGLLVNDYRSYLYNQRPRSAEFDATPYYTGGDDGQDIDDIFYPKLENFLSLQYSKDPETVAELKESAGDPWRYNKTQMEMEYGVFKTYNAPDLLNDLKENALRAKKKYGDQLIMISGILSNVDSDGKYISISDNSISFSNIQCFITTEEQLDKVMNYNKGDDLVVFGTITDVGELMGYSMDLIDIFSWDEFNQ